MVTVAPFIFPLAVAGGLGRFALSPCAQVINVMNTPANVKIIVRLIRVLFIVVKEVMLEAKSKQFPDSLTNT